MLPPELIKKIKRIHIVSSRTVNTTMAGNYRSVFRGSGMEFEEVREYSPGDDVKSIDWKVSARMGKPYVKLYREERELVVMLLVDMSASGLFGTTDSLKREVFTEIASVLAFNAIRNNDKVGAVLFTRQVEKYIPPKKGSSHVWRVIKEILSFTPRDKQTDIGSAANFLAKVSRKKTVAFIISDFLADGFVNALKRARRRHELIGAVVSDPGDFVLPEAGLLTAEDLETGQRIFIDCSDRRTRGLYEEQQRTKYRRVLEQLRNAGLDYFEMSTDGSVADVMNGFFRRREKRLKW